MKLFFPNLTRPKKASRELSRALSVPLSSAQAAIAKACGYIDWHDLEANGTKASPSALDQDIDRAVYILRQAELVISIAQHLRLQDGDVQHSLSSARLTGDRVPNLDDQIDIRLAVWRATSLPAAPKHSPGAVGTLRTAGRNGEHAILQSFGKPTRIITHQNIGIVADFEYISPRTPPSLFLPMRLYVPYGLWIERDGATVVFSRDYKPMWRLRKNSAPERLEPWLWISKTSETHLWPTPTPPWRSPALHHKMLQFLNKHDIFTLPILSDCLPLLVNDHDNSLATMAEAPEILKKHRQTDIQP